MFTYFVHNITELNNAIGELLHFLDKISTHQRHDLVFCTSYHFVNGDRTGCLLVCYSDKYYSWNMEGHLFVFLLKYLIVYC